MFRPSILLEIRRWTWILRVTSSPLKASIWDDIFAELAISIPHPRSKSKGLELRLFFFGMLIHKFHTWSLNHIIIIIIIIIVILIILWQDDQHHRFSVLMEMGTLLPPVDRRRELFSTKHPRYNF